MAYNRLYSWLVERITKGRKLSLERRGLDYVIKDQQKHDSSIKEEALANTIFIILTLVSLLTICIVQIITLW